MASTFLGYLPISYGQILLFLKVELRLGVLPSDWLYASNGAANRTGGCPPVLFRLIFRCSFLLFYLLLAQVTLHADTHPSCHRCTPLPFLRVMRGSTLMLGT